MINSKYEYRRNLPHYQKSDRAHYVTFVTWNRCELPPAARDLVLEHCVHDHGRVIDLQVVVVMPDHVHLIGMPLRDSEGNDFLMRDVLGGIKGASSHSVNRLLKRRGHVWLDESFDQVLRHEESIAEKIEYVAMNPIRRGLCRTPGEYKWLWLP